MKKSVTVSVNEKKLSAIEMYLEQKNTTLAAELEKVCGSALRQGRSAECEIFIDMMSDRKPARKPKNPASAEPENSPSSNSPQFAPCRLVWRGSEVGGITLPLTTVGANLGHFCRALRTSLIAEFENGRNQMISGGFEGHLIYCWLKFLASKPPKQSHRTSKSSPILRGFTSLDKMESKKEVYESHGVKSTKNEKKHRCCRRKRWCHSRKNQVSVVCISRDYENG